MGDFMSERGKGPLAMGQICLVVPIMAGKTAEARDFMRELEEQRKPGYDRCERQIPPTPTAHPGPPLTRAVNMPQNDDRAPGQPALQAAAPVPRLAHSPDQYRRLPRRALPRHPSHPNSTPNHGADETPQLAP